MATFILELSSAPRSRPSVHTAMMSPERMDTLGTSAQPVWYSSSHAGKPTFTDWRKVATYADHARAMAELETPYSSVRFQPMNQATPSPSVAYAYEYAEPDTGILAASSA